VSETCPIGTKSSVVLTPPVPPMAARPAIVPQ
jgi:hypothetical protein